MAGFEVILYGRFWVIAEVVEGRVNSRSLHYAPPDFLLNLVALSHFMRPSLRKGARAALYSAAWQEIRVRFGRDDTSVATRKSRMYGLKLAAAR
jgi:hypothetical protein